MKLKDKITQKEGVFKYQLVRFVILFFGFGLLLWLLYYITNTPYIKAWFDTNVFDMEIEDILILIILSRFYKSIFE